jgi:hypothetical protein
MFPPKKGNPKPTPAGPGGKFDPNDSPGKDENGDGIYGRPVKRSTNPDAKAGKAAPKGSQALAGLKKAKP